MPQWLTDNALLIIVLSTIALISFDLALRRVKRGSKESAPKKQSEIVERRLSLLLKIIVGLGLTFIGMAAAAIVLSEEGIYGTVTTAGLQEWFLVHGIFIIAVVSVAYLSYRLISWLMNKVLLRTPKAGSKGRRARDEQLKRAETLVRVLKVAVLVTVVSISLLIILAQVGISITPLLTAGGVAGIVIGFGTQSMVKDVLRGMIIITQNQYNKGDVVKIAGISGLVEDVTLMRTVLRDLDGIVHSIPNGEVTTASNYTKEWSRVNLNIAVAYCEDLDHVIDVINRVGTELSQDQSFASMIVTPPKVLRVDNLGDSGIELKVVGDTKPIKQWDVMGELRKRIKNAFDAEGIEIPLPHLKLYVAGSTPRDRICPNCSQRNINGARFCMYCGANLNQ